MSNLSTNRPGFFGAGSVEVSPGVRRLAITAHTLVTQPFQGINTTVDIIEHAAKTHGTKPALGWRDVVDVHTEEKEVSKIVDGVEVKEMKEWKFFELSDYKYVDFVQLKEAISEVARGLVECGVTKENIVNVYSQTSMNWQLMSHGCASISTTIATAYDTLGESGLQHSINEPECVAIFTNAELLPTVAKVLKNTPTLRLVIYDGEPKAELLDTIRAIHDSRVMSLDELRALGKPLSMDQVTARSPTPETVACIMYTSGSTGAPKGVVIPHSNLVASVGAVYTLLSHHLSTDDTYIAYLPLAHIMEYIVELTWIFVGMTTGFGRVKTLTDASVRNCKGDLGAFKPSIMVGVPAVWETIRKGVIAKVNAGSSLKKRLFNGAMGAKRKNIPLLAKLADTIVLSNIKVATGGRLRIALSGGAALSKETQDFLTIAVVTLLQGYGMTESCGMCAVLPPELFQYGSVGLPMASVEVKFRDVPEAGYLATNALPQGEICIRGPSVIKGYYKRPDLNEDPEIFTEDGWFRTGDIGQWNKDGTLTLIDRIKNLVKLQGGEYIALEALEAVYKSCNLVANICLYATADATQPIAIVIPHEANLRHVLPADEAPGSMADLCTRTSVHELILRECNLVGKKNGMSKIETLEAVVLTPDEWTPESGLVTAAMKIQRTAIARHFAEEIKTAYKH